MEKRGGGSDMRSDLGEGGGGTALGLSGGGAEAVAKGEAAFASGRFEEAAAHFAEAVKADPTSHANYFSYGRSLFELNQIDGAIVNFHSALSFNRDFAPAHHGLALAFLRKGITLEGLARYRIALSLQPQNLSLLREYGDHAFRSGRFGEAREAFERLLDINPDDAGAQHDLGITLSALGFHDSGFRHTLSAFRKTGSQLFRGNALRILTTGQGFEDTPLLRGFLEEAITVPYARPEELLDCILRLFFANPHFGRLLTQAVKSWPEPPEFEGFGAGGDVDFVMRDQLFATSIETMVVGHAGFEFLLTHLRARLLKLAESGGEARGEERFWSALAIQCYLNEYVFAMTREEDESVAKLGAEMEKRLADGRLPEPVELLAYAAYRPLGELKRSERLLDGGWRPEIEKVLRFQVREPMRERELRGTIPDYTPIDDSVSVAVRGQYEENPYPRWVGELTEVSPLGYDDCLKAGFPHAPFRPLGIKGGAKILVAGCGTGRHTVGVAQRFLDCSILGVDLSLSSLSCAKRKAEELGFSNIEFAQADILKLGSLGRKFDHIESVGVLHHMDEPKKGWDVLCSLLNPNGVMYIGLYSAPARRVIASIRRMIADEGYESSIEGIRKCRRELFTRLCDPELNSIFRQRDFFSTSMCRDLLFHVQEHNHTIPEIKSYMEDLGLEMLGIQCDASTRKAYLEMFPEDPGIRDLDKLHLFETRYPDAFIQMYHFWMQKKA